jgi:protein TonB
MADSPVTTPHPDAALGSITSPHALQENNGLPRAAKPSAILDVLRQEIAGGTRSLDAISAAIARSAQALTGANAAALAMRKEGTVVCVGRSGDSAPEVGTLLSVDSGISGECLRTGKLLRCDDTQKDLRVDPVVCLSLGLRSIAVAPLRGRHGIMGVLEVFSPRPFAFADEDIAALRELAELAETARARTFARPLPPVAKNPEPLTTVSGPSFSDVLRAKTEAVLEVLHPNNRVFWVTTAVLSMLLVVAVAGWKVWRNSAAGTASVQAAAPVTPNPNTTQTVIDWHPAPPKPSAGKSPIQNASEIQREQVIRRVTSNPATQTTTDPQPLAADSTTSSDAAAPAENTTAPPEAPLVAANLSEKALGGVLAANAPMPRFATPVSQGVSGGVLIHKVAPGYPVQAIPLRLEGDVVLQATITENGSVRDLKVVRGHPMLTPAALDAVRQWRYSPYELNGKPIAMKTTITINFKTSSR